MICIEVYVIHSNKKMLTVKSLAYGLVKKIGHETVAKTEMNY